MTACPQFGVPLGRPVGGVAGHGAHATGKAAAVDRAHAVHDSAECHLDHVAGWDGHCVVAQVDDCHAVLVVGDDVADARDRVPVFGVLRGRDRRGHGTCRGGAIVSAMALPLPGCGATRAAQSLSVGVCRSLGDFCRSPSCSGSASLLEWWPCRPPPHARLLSASCHERFSARGGSVRLTPTPTSEFEHI